MIDYNKSTKFEPYDKDKMICHLPGIPKDINENAR